MSAHPTPIQAAAQLQANTLFASLELSKARWLVTVSAPGSDKLSRHQVPGGDGQALLELLWRLQAAAARRTGAPVMIIVIQEAGLDGFWIHRLLVQNGIMSISLIPPGVSVHSATCDGFSFADLGVRRPALGGQTVSDQGCRLGLWGSPVKPASIRRRRTGPR